MSSILSDSSSTDGQQRSLWKRITSKLNFFRIHLLFFTFTPLIFSGIFYVSNGQTKISYADSLFNCVSAMAVCGLATINLSTLTPFQQVLLFIQMCIGNPVIVSWVIVYMRRHYFALKFQDILKGSAARRVQDDIEQPPPKAKEETWAQRFFAFVKGRRSDADDELNPQRGESPSGVLRKLRPDMIRRMDDAPKLVNPSGWVSEGRSPVSQVNVKQDPDSKLVPPNMADDSDTSSSSNPVKQSSREKHRLGGSTTPKKEHQRRLSDPGVHSRPASPTSSPTKMHRFETVAEPEPMTDQKKFFPRTQTVEFAPDPARRRDKFVQERIPEDEFVEGNLRHHHEHIPFHHHHAVPPEMRRSRTLNRASSVPMSTHTTHTHFSHHHVHPVDAMTRNFGGFPSIFSIAKSVIGHLFPGVRRQLTRAVTIPATTSLTPSRAGLEPGKKHAPYISFDAVVGRNSKFHLLTQDQLDEIGGVEYRALNALLWILPLYHIGIQLIGFIVIAPYISTKQWRPVFEDTAATTRPLNTAWFSLFQVVSAYTNTGMSLVDESMIPFQKAYPMVFLLIILILAGNTCFPIFLRLMIWLLSKTVHETSRLHETLRFLLDHPRRCFIYLFPTHQTWFLFIVVFGLTCIDWVSFMVLDISTPTIEQIPIGVRFVVGLLQGIAVRAAGFSVVQLSALAPAVKVMYVVMMYISAYPIAMSVRTTNVYEEQSLGVFDPHEHDGDDDMSIISDPLRTTTWSRYINVHVRQQLAFDMWWMALSLFIICIIEKNNIENEANFGWFDVFRIIFELVSAYGTVGLSLGIPDQNYSFAGSMHTLSKLVICVVMLRGRHRALPVAIDRAILLPHEFKKDGDPDHISHSTGNDEHQQPFVYSETMNSRHTADYQNRLRKRSSRMSNTDRSSSPQDVKNDDPRIHYDTSSLHDDTQNP